MTVEFIPMLVISQVDFEKNQAIDVSAYVKQLQGNDYMPWGVSLTLLRKYNDRLAVGFEEDAEGRPYFNTPAGAYLKAYIYDKTTGNKTPSIFFPIRNNKRQASLDPDTANIGNQQQRAIAKVIAQEVGIGWSLYSRIDESMLELEEVDKSKPTASKVVPPAVASKKRTDDGLDF